MEAKENGRQCGHTGGRVEKLHSQKTYRDYSTEKEKRQ